MRVYLERDRLFSLARSLSVFHYSSFSLSLSSFSCFPLPLLFKFIAATLILGIERFVRGLWVLWDFWVCKSCTKGFVGGRVATKISSSTSKSKTKISRSFWVSDVLKPLAHLSLYEFVFPCQFYVLSFTKSSVKMFFWLNLVFRVPGVNHQSTLDLQ